MTKTQRLAVDTLLLTTRKVHYFTIFDATNIKYIGSFVINIMNNVEQVNEFIERVEDMDWWISTQYNYKTTDYAYLLTENGTLQKCFRDGRGNIRVISEIQLEKFNGEIESKINDKVIEQLIKKYNPKNEIVVYKTIKFNKNLKAVKGSYSKLYSTAIPEECESF